MILFCLVLRTALVAVVGTVVVEFDFNVGLDELVITGQTELHVLDVQSTGYPHRLVVGLDA